MYRKAQASLREGISTIVVGTHRSLASHDTVRQIVQATGSRILVAELTAPIEDLVARASQRGTDHPSGVRSEEAIMEELADFYRFIDPSPIIRVDTSKYPPELVADKIISAIEASS